MQQLQKIAENTEFEKKFGLPLNEIEDIKVVRTSAGNPFESSPRPPFQRLVIRSVKPHDWKKLISEKSGGKPKQIGDKTFYELDGDGAFIPDDRTLVLLFVHDEVEMKKIILRRRKAPFRGPELVPIAALFAICRLGRHQVDQSGTRKARRAVGSDDRDDSIDVGAHQFCEPSGNSLHVDPQWR